MSNVTLSKPKLGFIVGTRAALGLGAGLLLSNRLGRRRRNRLGKALVTVGALSTIPAAMLVLGRRKLPKREG